MLTHKELTEKALSDPEVAKEYARLEPKYALLNELLRAKKAQISQPTLAQAMEITVEHLVE